MQMSNNRKGTPQRSKMKKCVFPGCNVEFIGMGKAKYCEEHRKAKYRKELYKKNDNEGEAIINIPHTESHSTEVERVCALKGCNNTYTITLIPKLFEYSNYCPEHRNEYKRERFLRENDI